VAPFGDRRIDDSACQQIQCVLELIGQRWTGAILIVAARGARRFSEYRTMVDRVFDRLLAVRLRALEAVHLIERTVIPSTPVQIRYAPTSAGVELVTALQPLMDFAQRHVITPTAAPRSDG